MATILFAAVGSAVGASIGGGVLGISSVVLGRAAGAVLGRALDQRLRLGGSRDRTDGPFPVDWRR